MQIVYKFQLRIGNSVQRFDLPVEAKPLHVAMQDGKLQMWVLLDPTTMTIKRRFVVYGTGQYILPPHARHVGTVLDDMYVWHVFEA